MYTIIATCIHFYVTLTAAATRRTSHHTIVCEAARDAVQHAGETAVAPLVVQGPQVRAALIEGMRPSAAVCGAAASGAGGVACLGLVTAGHK